jgi:hypothetical protein
MKVAQRRFWKKNPLLPPTPNSKKNQKIWNFILSFYKIKRKKIFLKKSKNIKLSRKHWFLFSVHFYSLFKLKIVILKRISKLFFYLMFVWGSSLSFCFISSFMFVRWVFTWWICRWWRIICDFVMNFVHIGHFILYYLHYFGIIIL